MTRAALFSGSAVAYSQMDAEFVSGLDAELTVTPRPTTE
jgi:hypothetical protein